MKILVRSDVKWSHQTKLLKMTCRSRREGERCTELASLAFPWQHEADEQLILVLLKAGLLV